MSQPNIEQRLQEIEHQLRRWKRLSLVLLAVGAIALVGWAPLEPSPPESQSPPDDTVNLKDVLPEGTSRADELKLRKLNIVDGQGRTRIDLAVSEVGPTIRLFDERGTPRTTFFLNQEGSGLSLTDANSQTRAGLSVLDDNAEFRFLDAAGKTWAVLMEKDRKRMFVLAGSDPSARMGALLSDAGASLTVAGGGGQQRITTRAGGDGATFSIIDADGSTLLRQP